MNKRWETFLENAMILIHDIRTKTTSLSCRNSVLDKHCFGFLLLLATLASMWPSCVVGNIGNAHERPLIKKKSELIISIY